MNEKEFKYFTLEEFEKSSSDKVPTQYLDNAYEILGILDIIRHHYGHPLVILSGGGYRNADFNEKLDGAKSSRHLIAQAMDVRPLKSNNFGEIKVIKALAEKLLKEKSLPTQSELGIGIYDRGEKSFIHIDCRKGMKSRWEGK